MPVPIRSYDNTATASVAGGNETSGDGITNNTISQAQFVSNMLTPANRTRADLDLVAVNQYWMSPETANTARLTNMINDQSTAISRRPSGEAPSLSIPLDYLTLPVHRVADLDYTRETLLSARGVVLPDTLREVTERFRRGVSILHAREAQNTGGTIRDAYVAWQEAQVHAAIGADDDDEDADDGDKDEQEVDPDNRRVQAEIWVDLTTSAKYGCVGARSFM